MYHYIVTYFSIVLYLYHIPLHCTIFYSTKHQYIVSYSMILYAAIFSVLYFTICCYIMLLLSLLSYHLRQLYSVCGSPILHPMCVTNFTLFSSASSFSFIYPTFLLWNSLILHPLQLSITQPIMDGFWCSRCLNDRIAVPEMMGSFSGGSTTPLVVKSGTKQAWWKVFFF